MDEYIPLTLQAVTCVTDFVLFGAENISGKCPRPAQNMRRERT
jgi:hypothetical protein